MDWMRKHARLILGLAISAFFLYFAVQGLSLGEVATWITQANYLWLVPSVAIYFVAVWGRTWRWHYMLRPIKVISLRRLFPVVCIGYMGNNIFPVRAGEVLRAYVLKRSEEVSMGASIATILVERVFDGLVMLMFVFIALPFAPVPDNLRAYVVGASVLFFGALVAFFALAIKPEFTRKTYSLTLRRLVPERFRLSLDGLLDRFLEGLSFMRSGRDIVMIFVTSVFIWLAETGKYWFVMEAFAGQGGGFPVPFFVLMLMNGIVNLATTIPSAPGYVGTFDTPGIAVLVAYGVDKDLAFGYTIVLHAALWFPITILGAWYFRRERLSWADVDLARAQQAASLEPLS
jgi:uncharacterized protein (TIRG00374 family)